MGNVNVQGGALEFNAIINMQQFQSQLNRMEASLQGITQTAKQQSDQIEGFAKTAATAIGTYLSVTGIQNFVGDLVRVRGEFQQLEVAFTTMLGSKEKADKLMKQVAEFAATTPFELDQTANATKQLLAFGIQSDKVIDTLRSLGDVAAGIGAPIGDLAYLFGTIKTQGVAMTIDVRQFAQRGIPIYEELAKVLKVNVQQVGDFITAGKVGFPEIEQAFKNMTAEGSKFGGLMDAQSKTLTGQLSNLSDAWTRMLNDIGQSGEGVFADTISAASSLVEHYQDVLDILKVLAITYGTYKAAVIATTVVQAIQTAATKGYTIAEQLRYRAMLISEAAMKLLNKTMLSNPAGLVIAGIAALAATLLIFTKNAEKAKRAQELLNDAQDQAVDQFAKQETEINKYVETLKDQNIAESVRLEAYNKLKEIAPEIIKNLTFQAAKTTDLTDATNTYIASLRQAITLEGKRSAYTEALKQRDKLFNEIKNESFDSNGLIKGHRVLGMLTPEGVRLQQTSNEYRIAAQTVIDVEKNIKNSIGGTAEAIRFQIETLEDQNKFLSKTSLAYKQNEDQINSLKKTLASLSNAKPTKALADFLADQNNLLSNFDDYVKLITNKAEADKVKKALVEKMESFAPGDQAKEAYKKKIQEVNKLIDSYGIDGNKGISKQQESIDAKINSLLEARKNILQDIAGLQRDAAQTGITKQQSELQKINDKYDSMIDKIVEFNQKTDEFNRKNKTNVQKLGILDLALVNEARNKEIGGTALIKQGSEIFKQDLEAQRKIFDDFQQAVKEIGIEKAQEIFGEQTKGFTSFLSFLQAEAKKNINLINPEKMAAITKAINDEQKKTEEDLFKERFENYKRLITATASFNQQRLAYERQYEKDVADLKKEFTGQELEERLKVLKELKDADLKALGENIAGHTKGWRTLNQNLVNFTRARIKQEIEALENILKNSSIDESTKKAINEALEEWKKLDKAISDTRTTIDAIIEAGEIVKSTFSQLASAVEPFSSELAQSLNSMSQLVDSAIQASKALDAFKSASKSGDVVGQIAAATDIITAIIKAIGVIVEGVKKTKQAMKDVQQQTADFYTQLITGELTYQQLLRERQRQIILNNKSTLDGLEAQRKLLQQQRQENAKQAADLFTQLQSESFLSGVEAKKKGLFRRNILELFSNKPTEIRQITESLAGKTFDQLEELFNKGQLIGKAKELFEQLQKIKQEGADIDALLEENKRNVQEAFTGTSSQSITDSIVDGFRNGLRGAQDFAGTFEELMRDAMLSSLKFQYLEPALKEFFEQFAEASQSDNTLTKSEIDNLQNLFNSSISDFDEKIKQFEQISGINLQTSSADSNSLKGAIKSMTEQTAELLAGQMGGLRLTAIDQLNLMRQALNVQQAIENNTALTAARIEKIYVFFNDVASGSKALKIQ